MNERATLLQLIAAIEATGEPTLLSLVAENGTVLSVGLGARDTIVLLEEGPEDAFHSLGDPDRGGVLQFYGWHNEPDDFFAEGAIPAANAIPSLLSFWDSGGKRPDGITWESDF